MRKIMTSALALVPIFTLQMNQPIEAAHMDGAHGGGGSHIQGGSTHLQGGGPRFQGGGAHPPTSAPHNFHHESHRGYGYGGEGAAGDIGVGNVDGAEIIEEDDSDGNSCYWDEDKNENVCTYYD